MAILVTHEAIHDANHVEIGPVEWRVAVDDNTRYLALPMVFGRKQDAERARNALESAGLASSKALQQAGKAAVMAKMLDSLAW